ncbi:NPCBM/NEW2 domain-containing protein [Streptomyces sp. NRRL B-24484]|uniref:NPCBM/NEW2 domain-containing protein n=1 Tax=Streptomyces sp. NRRL B-24484 TaxID=1463833 RepID=UPI000693574C|nr:NPCBM/NEW2 domain-containing protein [Streptomyces sp. NRRL B-24484]
MHHTDRGRLRGRRTLALTIAAALSASVGPLMIGAATPAAAAQTNGAALTPAMGWSSWSTLRTNPTEANIKAEAKAMSDNGLVSHGFKYINVDDFYYLAPQTNSDAFGRWKIDPAHFPNGMKAVGDYVHGLGEKFGMYVTPGIPVDAYAQNKPIEGTGFHAQDIVSDTTTYATNFGPGRNGGMYNIDFNKNPAAAQAFYNSWANLLASWGVDYLKLDGVNSDTVNVKHWSQALNQTGRPIHLGLSLALDHNYATTWQANANSWRTDGDLECYSCPGVLTNWANVAQRFTSAPQWAAFNGPGGWNDLDSLEIGNGPTKAGLTRDEMQTHMTLWAVANSSLMLGTDLTSLDPTDLAMLKNDEVIAVNQAGRTARPIDQSTQQQVWYTPNPDGTYTVALFNLGSSTANVTVNWSDLGISGTATVHDLWTKTNTTGVATSLTASLPTHGSRLLKVTPNTQAAPPKRISQLSDLAWSSTPPNGWGPVERDHSNGESAAGDGRTLTIGGTTYTKGLGAHANSDITYYLGGTCSAVTATVGVDDEVGSFGSVTFQILRDGAVVANSGTRTGSDGPVNLTADLTGGQQLTLRVTDNGDGNNSDHADWANPKIACGMTAPTTGSHALSDLNWSSTPTNGWGPVERDHSNGEQAAGDGHTLTIGGTTYTKGLGTNANSEITYYLGGRCTNLTTTVGVDDEVGSSGTVTFQILRDGVVAANSGTRLGTDGPLNLTGDLTGAMELTLRATDNGDGNSNDHADWAQPVITCT